MSGFEDRMGAIEKRLDTAREELREADKRLARAKDEHLKAWNAVACLQGEMSIEQAFERFRTMSSEQRKQLMDAGRFL